MLPVSQSSRPSRTAPGAATATSSGTLPATAPFDFARSLEFVAGFEPMEGEQVVTEDGLTKALRLNGRTVAFRVTASRSADGVAYTLYSREPLPAAVRREVANRISFFLSLDDDLEPFYRLAAADPPMADAVANLRGLHQVKFLTPFENAAWAVLAQRVAIPVARRMKSAMVERYGASLQVDGHEHAAFPEPDDLAGASLDDLAGVIRNRARARALGAVAEAFLSVDEQWLRTGPIDDVEAWLRGIHGIGPWSASFVLFRGLGRLERLPMTPPMLRAARRIYGEGTTDREIQEIAARYGPWCGYWSMYSRVAA